MTKEEIIELRKKGMTYEEIGEVFGVSRQRIHQKLTGYASPYQSSEKCKEHRKQKREYYRKKHKTKNL